MKKVYNGKKLKSSTKEKKDKEKKKDDRVSEKMVETETFVLK